MSGSSSCVLRVEVGRGAAQETGFQDVSTATVREEAALVQVHLFAGCLEVQSHCGNNGVTNAAGLDACGTHGALTHLTASVPHFLRIIVGRLEALSRGVDPAQLSAVVSHKKLPCKLKDTEGRAVIHRRLKEFQSLLRLCSLC